MVIDRRMFFMLPMCRNLSEMQDDAERSRVLAELPEDIKQLVTNTVAALRSTKR